MKRQEDPQNSPTKNWMNSVQNGNRERLTYWLTQGVDVNFQDHLGWSALAAATRNADAKTVEFLLKHNADPNLKDNWGNTALHGAFCWGYEEDCVKILLKYQPNLEEVNNENQTVLSSLVERLATREEKEYSLTSPMLIMLIQAGADVFAVTRCGHVCAEIITSKPDMFEQDAVEYVKMLVNKKDLTVTLSGHGDAPERKAKL